MQLLIIKGHTPVLVNKYVNRYTGLIIYLYNVHFKKVLAHKPKLAYLHHNTYLYKTD